MLPVEDRDTGSGRRLGILKSFFVVISNIVLIPATISTTVMRSEVDGFVWIWVQAFVCSAVAVTVLPYVGMGPGGGLTGIIYGLMGLVG